MHNHKTRLHNLTPKILNKIIMSCTVFIRNRMNFQSKTGNDVVPFHGIIFAGFTHLADSPDDLHKIHNEYRRIASQSKFCTWRNDKHHIAHYKWQSPLTHNFYMREYVFLEDTLFILVKSKQLLELSKL